MDVKDKVMYHFHKNGIYDEVWNLGSEFIVDNNFNSYLGDILKCFSTTIYDSEKSLHRVLNYYLSNNNLSNLTFNQIKILLTDSRNIIANANMYMREMMMEEYRKKYFHNLPSRLHSIWVCDKKQICYWNNELNLEGSNRRLSVYQVLLNGNLFETSDEFIPDSNLTSIETFNESERYWNPKFLSENNKERKEYLFQGNVKILKKLR